MVTVGDIATMTSAEIYIERCGVRIFDSQEGSYKEYKNLKNERVIRIEPDSDGGSKYLTMVIQ